MSSNGDIPFESDADVQLRQTANSMEDTDRKVAGYINQQGLPAAQRGTLTGPYVLDVGRASTDGTAGSVTVNSGEDQRILVDQLGRLWIRGIIDPVTITGAITANVAPIIGNTYTSTAFEIQHSIVAAAGHPLRVARVQMLLKAGVTADRTLMTFDSDIAVVNSAVPLWRTPLPNPGAGIGACWDVFDAFVFQCSKGITVAISTTPDILTLDGANALFEVLYKAV